MVSDPTVFSAPSRRVREIVVGVTLWRVFEHVPQYDRRARTTLVFVSEGAMRRVRDFPAHWWELSDEELLGISWRR